jgi:predicted transcriptional regulator of viral defense system
LAGRQYGVVSARQMRALGYSEEQISGAAGSGRLLRIHRGVYAVGHRRIGWHGHCLAAVLASAPALASHASAGKLWGLLRYEPGSFDVTAPTRRHAKPDVRVHFARLTVRDEAVVDAIPATSVSRTILDLASTLSPARLGKVVERADELRLFDLAAVDELLGRVTRHRGITRLRSVLALYRDEPLFTRSELERRFRAAVVGAGLPAPSMNFNVAGFEIDAYWGLERFGVELDAYATHGGRAAFERDRVRQEELKLAGVEIVRITAKRFDSDPATVVERVAALLERRRRELAARPLPESGGR